jgi:hypothetical protein
LRILVHISAGQISVNYHVFSATVYQELEAQTPRQDEESENFRITDDKLEIIPSFPLKKDGQSLSCSGLGPQTHASANICFVAFPEQKAFPGLAQESP